MPRKDNTKVSAIRKVITMQKARAFGVALMILALLANPYILGRLFAATGKITSPHMNAIIIIFELGLLSIGAYIYRRPEEYRKVLALGLMCLIMLFPADYAVTKLLKPQHIDDYRQPDKILDHKFIPNGSGTFTSVTNEFTTEYKINSIGLRNPEVAQNKTKIRILMLGDSFTEGYGVNYTDSIPKKLNDYLGDKYEVINGGVASYSPAPEYLYLKTEGIELEPDIVILDFDNSDIQDDMLYGKHATYDKNGELITLSDWTSTFRAYFANTFNLINRVFYRDPDHTKYFLNYHNRQNDCSEFEKQWNVSFKYLNKTKHYLEDRNVSFYVTIYPWGHQVATDQWIEGRKYFGFDNDTIYPFAFADCFRNHTYGENFTVFNVLRDFREEAKDKKLYYNIDQHMTADGYDVMAKGIYKRLVNIYGAK